MIYKLSDGTRVRTTRDGDAVEFEYFRYNPRKEVLRVESLKGEEAEKRLAEVVVGDAIRFGEQYAAGPDAIRRTDLEYSVGEVVRVRRDIMGTDWDTWGRVTAVFPYSLSPYGVELDESGVYARFAVDEVSDFLAHTGRPMSAVIVGAAIATVAGIGFIFAPDAQAPDYPLLKDVITAPVVTPTPVAPKPYKPEPRPSTLTSREGVRETLTPKSSPSVVKPSKTPATKHAIPTPPADVRISFYRNCGALFQRCVDGGALTHYAGNILAGHNYMGYQWLSRVPVGRTVRVISGPLAGTYEVYGHLRINRQGGSIPAFAGSPDLVLQTCEGSGTGFSLLRRA
ncbi:hypothetical protein [Streptomyces umbrinus]|uniref:hypothetical protein n=1 Tax=Streptomyces umbrinus TaxID=67370 RepID=UPI0034401F50